jgi:magnesium transporter
MDQEKVAHMFRHYALVTAPVINESGRMVGVICMDDILHVLHKEATEDMLKLGGVSDPDFHASILRTSYTRIRWLIFTFLNTLIASSVLMQFEKTLEKSVALAILMPIVAAMGGNQGMQVVTVVVRALATGQIRMGNIFKVFFKEFSVGIINGVFFGTILGTIASGWFHSPKLGIILAIAMLFNMAWAAFAGTLVPVIFERLGFDPAISSGPVLTTTTDVLGFTAFLGLSTLFLFN